jgi:hypothetical protein
VTPLIKELKNFIAKELTCKDIKLKSEEVSIRLVVIKGDGMIGNVEIDIKAHAFKERVKRQDEICLNIMRYIQKKIPSIGTVKVWLALSELGHSWE